MTIERLSVVMTCRFAHCWHSSKPTFTTRLLALLIPSRTRVSCCRCSRTALKPKRWKL